MGILLLLAAISLLVNSGHCGLVAHAFYETRQHGNVRTAGLKIIAGKGLLEEGGSR
jgi:hypothetical protein